MTSSSGLDVASVVGDTSLHGVRVSLLWSRIGPYHMARATAAEARLREHGAVLRLAEVCGQDLYAWDTRDICRPSWATTLFPSGDYTNLSSWAIHHRTRMWLDETNADLVVTNGWGVSEARAALRWAGESVARRAVVMSETKFDDEVSRKAWKEWLKRRLVSRADAGLVGGDQQRKYLSGLGIPIERIFLGYNAVDNEYFASAADVSRELGSRPTCIGDLSAPYFLASSRFIPRKNLDGLLQAYAGYRTHAGGAPWHLVIAGSGAEEGALRELSKTLSLEQFVHWAGFVQYCDLPGLYAGAEAFIHPAKVEPWGLVVNEAAACSLPLMIAAPVGARYQLLEDGVHGFAFDPYSVAEMSDAMLRMSRLEPASRARMGAAARERVEHYGPERFANGLVCAVRAALGAGH